MLLVSLAVYAVSFVLLRLLSRYRELAADRAGAYLTMRPDALASALQKITGGINQIPQRDLRQVGAASALCIAPAIGGVSLQDADRDAPVAGAAARAAGPDPGRAQPSVDPDRVGLWDTITGRSRPKRANLDALFLVPSAAITLQTAAGLTPTGDGSVCYRAADRGGVPRRPRPTSWRCCEAAADAPQVQTELRRVRLHVAAGAPGTRRP